MSVCCGEGLNGFVSIYAGVWGVDNSKHVLLSRHSTRNTQTSLTTPPKPMPPLPSVPSVDTGATPEALALEALA